MDATYSGTPTPAEIRAACKRIQAGWTKPKRPRRNREPHYLPSPAEIRRECEAIQRGWSDVERRKRAAGPGEVPWETPEVCMPAVRALEHD